MLTRLLTVAVCLLALLAPLAPAKSRHGQRPAHSKRVRTKKVRASHSHRPNKAHRAKSTKRGKRNRPVY